MTAPTITLTEFLLARIAEDEMQAQAVGDHGWLYDGFGCKAMVRPDTKLEYADRWMPSRVLVECQAKRLLIERVGNPAWAGFSLLALPYADHPDYNPTWRP